MRIPIALAVAAFALAAFIAGEAAATQIGGKHGRDEIKKTCDAAGGSYWSNLDRYGCSTTCTAKGETCSVSCDNSGKCDGFTPPAAAALGGMNPSLTVGGALGVFEAAPPTLRFGITGGGTATTGK